MNPFILDCYTKLKLFFNNCSNVDDPEIFYNINEFTDVTLLTKPTINITLQVCTINILLIFYCVIENKNYSIIYYIGNTRNSFFIAR